MKNCPVGAEMFHADERTNGRTDERTNGRTERHTEMTKLIVALRNSANAPENWFRQAHWLLLHHSVQIGCV